MRYFRCSLAMVALMFCAALSLRAESSADMVCPRPAEGSVVQEPPSLESRNGRLDTTLYFRSVKDSEGNPRFCYVTPSGIESPTLKLMAGDHLIVHLKNELSPETAAGDGMPGMKMGSMMHEVGGDACHAMSNAATTNMHFHGMILPPKCHQDESVHALVAPGTSFDYDMQIPAANTPGLYWYHPHPHGYSTMQVQGGATGAIVVEGINSIAPALSSLPARTFILRDQPMSPAVVDSQDPLKPSWDISLNYVPVRYPRYVPAVIETRPKEKQFWRFVNAAANTIFHLQVIYDGAPQTMEVYAIDGVPVQKAPLLRTAVLLPPGSRIEFVVTAPAVGQTAQVVTLKHEPGPAGDSAPARPIANIVAMDKKLPEVKPESIRLKPSQMASLPTSLLDVKPVRTRNIYFSQNGNGTEGGAGAADKFYLTVLGQKVKLFDMEEPPNLTVEQGSVEDWNLQNLSPEDHIFHIHQVHFQLISVDGIPVDDPVIRDTILVPHERDGTPISVIKIRVDFRDPSIVGTFVYHCHILDHEDKGMMGSIEVVPAGTLSKAGAVVK